MTKINTRYLIVGPAWVGDMVMAQVLFKQLHQTQSDLTIDVLAPKHSRPVLACMPEVRRHITMPLGHGELNVRARYQLGKSLRNQYTHAIVLPNSFKSALVPFHAKIAQRTGWLGEARWGLLNDVRYLNKKRYPLMIQRFAALAYPKGQSLTREALPKPALVVSTDSVTQTLAQLNMLHPVKPVLALCPGAEFGPAKRWPMAHYATVANTMLQRGWEIWLFGSPKEQADAASIQASTQHRCFDLTGQTTLGQAITLMSLAHAVVTNDSGLMHIAAALARPLVAVYGSSSPTFTPPLTTAVKIISLNLPCSPCFKRECPLTHLNCLKKLQPDTVINALQTLEASA